MSVGYDTEDNPSIDLAILKSVDADKYRARAFFLHDSSIQDVVLNPSPLGGHMPKEDSLCLLYRKGRFYCRLLMTLDEVLDDKVLSFADRVTRENKRHLPMSKGDVFSGGAGHTLWNDSGDVESWTENGQVRWSLTNEGALAALTCADFDFSSQGAGIKIFTESEPQADPENPVPILERKLVVEKNIVTTVLPKEVPGASALPSNITRMQIGFLGEFDLDVLTVGRMKIAQTGVLEYSNNFGSLKVDASGNIDLRNTLSILDMDVSGDIKLSNTPAFLQLLQSGNVTLKNTNASILFDPTGGITITGAKNVGISAGATMDLVSAEAATMVAPTINFNTGANGVARRLDLTLSNAALDVAFWKWVTDVSASLVAIYGAISGAPTVPLDGGAAYKAGMIALLAPVPAPAVAPAAQIGQINTASTTVKSG
jgi:hypothetical protein